MQRSKDYYTAELRRVHNEGAWNVSRSDFPRLASLAPLPARIEAGVSFGKALATTLTEVLGRMADRDEALGKVIFGLEPYTDLGPRQRHAVLETYDIRWMEYRKSMFSNLVSRIMLTWQALDSSADFPTITRGLGFHLRRLEQTYIEPRGSNPTLSISERRTLVVDQAELSEWSTVHRMQFSSALGPPVITCVFDGGTFSYGCRELTNQEGVGYHVDMSLRFPNPRKRGAVVDFEIIRTVPIDLVKYRAASPPWFTGFRAPVSINELDVRVSLDPANLPSRVQRVSNARLLERFDEGDDLEHASAPLPVESIVRARWMDPSVERWTGLYWR